jgi:hypothetical protein
LKDGDKVKITFWGLILREGLFIPMVNNGLAKFQRIMNQMLVNFNFATCYIDDNIIFSPTLGDHMHHLQ